MSLQQFSSLYLRCKICVRTNIFGDALPILFNVNEMEEVRSYIWSPVAVAAPLKVLFYVVGCRHILTDASGSFGSPGYPSIYPANSICSWTIRAPSYHKITLDFADFHLQGGSSCRHDSLDIYDGASIRDAKLGRFCGQNKPMLLTSSGNYFYLRFKSDGTTEKRGFRATYNTTQGKLHWIVPFLSSDVLNNQVENQVWLHVNVWRSWKRITCNATVFRCVSSVVVFSSVLPSLSKRDVKITATKSHIKMLLRTLEHLALIGGFHLTSSPPWWCTERKRKSLLGFGLYYYAKHEP